MGTAAFCRRLAPPTTLLLVLALTAPVVASERPSSNLALSGGRPEHLSPSGGVDTQFPAVGQELFAFPVASEIPDSEGGITGTVTNEVGEPLEEAIAQVFDESYGYMGSGYTDSSGVYSISGLPAGNYKVEFFDPSGRYLPQWWNRKRRPPEVRSVLKSS